jgi:restriction endonuclease S subunit
MAVFLGAINNSNNIEKLEKEQQRLFKKYFKLEDILFRTFEQQKELDKIEKRLSQIAKILENN